MASNSREFKHNCSIMSSPSAPTSLNVPAELQLSLFLSLPLKDSKGNTRATRQGHESKMLSALPRPELLLKHWDELYSILLKLLGTPRRAEMVKMALRLQVLSGKCFASAKYLAGAGFSNEKTWDRCLAYLKSQGWAETERAKRPNGYRSTNVLDLRKLWALIMAYLSSKASRIQRLSSGLWVKVHGAWMRPAQLPLLTESSS